MPIEPRPLPCAPAAFVPHLAPEQVERHRQAQQRTLDALDALRDAGDDDAAPDLARLAVEARGALAAHAAQAWAEEFHWAALGPARGDEPGEPGGALAAAIQQAFGDPARMRERFAEAAGRLSGPGWLWLAQRRDGRLAILATPASATPLTGGDTPLLACCLWPHAMPEGDDALARYLAGFWALVDWQVVEARLDRAREASRAGAGPGYPARRSMTGATWACRSSAVPTRSSAACSACGVSARSVAWPTLRPSRACLP